MVKDSVARFLVLLTSHQELVERLRPVVDPNEFDRRAAELGREHGLEFTADEFRAAIAEVLARNPSELSDEELEAVAAGMGCYPNSTAVGGASSAGCRETPLTWSNSNIRWLISAVYN